MGLVLRLGLCEDGQHRFNPIDQRHTRVLVRVEIKVSRVRFSLGEVTLICWTLAAYIRVSLREKTSVR